MDKQTHSGSFYYMIGVKGVQTAFATDGGDTQKLLVLQFFPKMEDFL